MSDMSDIIGSKGGEKEHVHYEAPDSLKSTSYARVLDLVSEGEILGLTNGLQSVFLNDTPVQNTDGTSNFTGVTIDFRTGTQTQDYIPGFPSVENEVGVGVELKSTAPWVHAINNTALSAIRITMGVPALSQSDTTNGDVKGYKIDYKIELAKDGGAYAAVLTSSFNGKTTTAYQRTARVDLPAATTGWQVRVTRLTANANTAAIADTTTIVSYTDVIDAKLRYPMSAIVGIQVDAKQFQNVPTRAYDLMGRVVQMPSNYNAKTRVYTGTWDGTFKPSWTDNPAWIFRDLALNDRYGLGHRITAAQLDKWSLYAIARYCDGMVPDGKGGTEPRFTCNLYLQTQKQAYAVLQDLASIFRGISYWGAGSIIASADMPTDPVYVYTAANVIGGKFSRVGSSKKTRYTTALVSWNDPADMYKAKVEYVEDPEGITRYGIQQASLTAFGCSSQGQAQRVGRWALATSRLETEMISFDVGMDGAIALPGQIIRVADPSRMGRRNGGRIKTASGRVVVLDKAPIVNAGDKLTVILPTGKSETRTVSSIAGDAVTVTADWSTMPLAQSVWSVDSSVLIAPTYKVRSVTEKDAMTYTISATQHEPGKFDFIELGTAITPRPQTALNAAVQQPPASVTVEAYTVSLQDVQKLGFIATCPAVEGAVAYEGAFQHDNSNWFTLPRQPGPVFDVLDVLAGYYTVKLAAVNALGITSIETISASTLVSKNANPKNADILLTPSAPGFNVNSDGSITPASITVHATLLDLDGIVTWSAVGATITSSNNNATIAATNMPGAAMTLTASIIALGQTFTRSIDIVKSADGAAGADKFYWIKYATSATGAGLTDNPTGMTYMGTAVNKSSPIESTVASDYTWVKISGDNGADGASVFTGVVYLQQAAQPSTPSGGTFNFTTLALTPPTGWSATQPTSSTTPTWAVRFTFRAATLGATVTAGTWSTPVNVSQNGTNGTNGATGSQSMVVFLYQYGTTSPAAPLGTSTLNWVTGANTSYNGSDGWSVSAPANPGTPGLRLYVATQSVTATGGTTSTSGITYTNAAISPWATNGANGANGSNGANGAQSAAPMVYQWAVTIPAGPSGSSTYTWATGLFGAAPSGWTLAPGAKVLGNTLWAAKVQLVDAAAATTTAFNWVNASITPQGYAGTDGSNGGAGAPGAEGLSYVTAYCASTTSAATSTPAATTGKTSVPAVNAGGVTGTWTAAAPTTLTTDQRIWQVDGIYNPATNQVTWQFPYWSVWKVGSLSAITLGVMGAITAGSIDLGSGGNSWHVDPSGNMWSGATTMAAAPFSVSNTGLLTSRAGQFVAADGTVLFSTGTGLTTAGAAPGTKNSEIAVAGRNIIVDGNFERGLRPWTVRSSGVQTVSINGAVGDKNLFITGNGDVYVNGGGDPIPVIAGKTYNLSFDFATSTTGAIGPAFGMYLSNGEFVAISLLPANTVTATVRSSTNWVCPTGVTSFTPRFGFFSTAASWIAVRTFKMAEGNTDTGWSAAPEDLTIGISNAASTAVWTGVSGTGKPADNATVGAPAGTLVAGVQAALVATATTNFNTSNDRNATAVVAPTILADGTAVDHVIRTDGAADISFEWAWAGAEGDIDGFLVYVYQSTSSAAYTFGTNPAAETVYTVPASKRAFIQFGAAANLYTTFGAQSYRSVDKEIAASGAIKSAIVKPSLAAENPYQPSASVAFVGNVTGTINGTAAATLTANVAAANAAIADIFNDNVLTPQEKVALKAEVARMNGERDDIIAKANAVSVSSALYGTRSNEFMQGLIDYAPGWDTLTTTTSVNGAAIDTVRLNYATARTLLLNAIAERSATTATAAGLTGQMTVAQVPNFIPPNGVTDALFGGNLKSSNWNGDTGTGGAGWLLERVTGNLYANNVKLRGSVMGGSYTGFSSPPAGQGGYYVGSEGAAFGNYASGRYAVIYSNGDVDIPGFQVVNKQITITNAILITPRINTTFAISIPGINATNQVNSSTFQSFGSFSAAVVNGVGPFRYQWTLSVENGNPNDIRMVGDPTSSTVQIQAKGNNAYLSAYLSLTMTDSNQATAGDGSSITIQFGSGVPI